MYLARRLHGHAKNIQYGYNQMFFETSYNPVPSEDLETCTPRQRRLFGDLGPGAKPSQHFYPPRDHLKLMLGAE